MRVLLGMSGGIDSSVSALLLKQQGYVIIGVTLRLWSQTDGVGCKTLPKYIIDAQNLASEINIEHHVIDVRQEFYDLIITYFKNEYLAGKTPNPCAKCNVVLKWKTLNEIAIQQHCNFIATGHYVNKTQVDGRFYITKGKDPDKEQSFFLWGLKPEFLQKALFPLGGYSKLEVREIALAHGLHKINSKKESTGVCFIADNDYQSFLEKAFMGTNILPGKGHFTDKNGAIIGKHNGFPFYTVGQRRGLGLAPNEPYYVTRIIAKTNTVQLGHRNDLYQSEMYVENFNVIDKADFEGEIITRIRYRKQSALSKVEFIDDFIIKVTFLSPEWSIAPGQTAAFYNDDRLLGGGFIRS